MCVITNRVFTIRHAMNFHLIRGNLLTYVLYDMCTNFDLISHAHLTEQNRLCSLRNASNRMTTFRRTFCALETVLRARRDAHRLSAQHAQEQIKS